MAKQINLIRYSLTSLIVGVLLVFASFPLMLIAYAAAGGLIGGMLILGSLMILQAPGFLLLHWAGALPSQKDPDGKNQTPID